MWKAAPLCNLYKQNIKCYFLFLNVFFLGICNSYYGEVCSRFKRPFQYYVSTIERWVVFDLLIFDDKFWGWGDPMAMMFSPAEVILFLHILSTSIRKLHRI